MTLPATITGAGGGGGSSFAEASATNVTNTQGGNSGNGFVIIAYLMNPGPSVTSVSPTSGPLAGATSVTISGSGFAGVTGVSFGSTPATNFNFVSDSSITATAPAGTGTVDVTVTVGANTSATSAADQFTYVPAPTVTALSVGAGPLAGSTTVTVTGTNFVTGATTVNFGVTAGTSVSVTSPTTLTVTSPAELANTVDITVTTAGGTSATSAADHFTYEAVPSVTAVSPAAGPLGGSTTVTVTGTNFVSGATTVNFGVTSGTNVSVLSATSLTVTSPAELANTVDITVTTAGGTSATSAADHFTYDAAPTVTNVSPASGVLVAGTSLTITGTNFITGATTVSFGGTPGTNVSVSSPTSLTVTAPADSSGPVNVTVTTAGGTSATGAADVYTYEAAPTVTAVSPAAGPLSGTTTVTVTGTNFVTGATTVNFGVTAGTNVSVLSSTSLTVTSPAELANTVDITVTTAGGTSATSAADHFTYEAAPTVTAVSPAAGPLAGATTVTVTGTNFVTGATTVNFGVTAGTNVSVSSATSLTVTSPAESANTVDLRVTTAGGISATSAADQFTYDAAPSVTNANLTASGTYGTAFAGYTITASAAGVTFSATGLPTGLSVNSSTGQITGTPTQSGMFNVTLGATNTGGTGNATLVLTISQATAGVVLSGLNQTYTGSAIAVSATTTPSGLATSLTYGGGSTPPTAPGSYAIVATVTDPNYSGTASGTLFVSQASQTLTFAPVAGSTVGKAIALSASASSGLAVSFTLVSGNATLSGSTLTLNDTNPVVVQASQAGNADYFAAASVSQTISGTKQSQTITFNPLPNLTTTVGTVTLTATASSGLPVTFSVLSGSATVSGSTLTLGGVAGTVVVQASQAGNATFASASATQSLTVTAAGTQVYFGQFSGTSTQSSRGQKADATLTSGLAATVSPTGAGTLIGTLPGGTAGFVVNFTVGNSGLFTASAPELTGSDSTGPTLNFSGSLSGSTLSGSIAGLNLTFSLTVDPTTGASASIAGLYQSSSLQAANGSTYSVVGTQNDVFVLALAPNTVAAGTGTVNGTSFSIQASSSVAVTGTINPTTTAVTGTITTASGTVNTSGLASATAPTDRLVNLSTLETVGSGQNMLVTGFVVGGSTSKPLLLRGIGPGLTQFGIVGTLASPTLQLFNSAGQLLATNSGWGGSTSLATLFTQVGAFSLSPTSADAAISTTLAPGAYTIQLSGAGGGTGKGLIEIYDATAEATNQYQELLNISSRGQVTGTSAPLTGGFIIVGNDSKQLLIRGVGPTLGQFGIGSALADPLLMVLDSNGNVLAENDNWGIPLPLSASQIVATASDITAAEATVGAFPLAAGSKDSALIITLPPGAYTVQVSGNAGGSGIALAEIYEIPPSSP